MTDGMNFEVIDGSELARRCFAGTAGRVTRIAYFVELKVIEEEKWVRAIVERKTTGNNQTTGKYGRSDV